MMQPARSAMILRDHALALRRRQHRRAELLGELHELRPTPCPEHAQAGDQDRPLARAPSMSSAGLRSARSGPERDPVRHQRRLGHVVAGLARASRSAAARNARGPAARRVAVRMARRTCWRTVLASMVVLHLTIGS